jgi:DNA-binding SARP family transcriptional activator
VLGSDVLARREWGYVLRADEGSIDLRRFERLVEAAAPLPALERSAKLAEALQLWRGPALADPANEPGLQTEIARLDELRLTILERRIDADLEAGRNAELVGEIEALIAAHPLREHLRWQLILALYRAGRQAEALEVYREPDGFSPRSSGSSRALSCGNWRRRSSARIRRSRPLSRCRRLRRNPGALRGGTPC